jgi:hypothetical protein
MNHFASPSYWDAYRRLPAEVQELANKSFELLKTNPQHPSLHFKKAGRHWSVRVGLHYRALARPVEGGLLWFWIGSHAEYDHFLDQHE